MRIPAALRRRGGPGDEGEQSARSFAATLALLVASLVIACATQVTGNIEIEQRSRVYTVLWPQGWVFFTDLGTKAVLAAYRTEAGHERFLPESQRQHWSDRRWGLDRVGEPQAWEITKIAEQIPQAGWHRCDAATVEGCRSLLTDPAPHPMTNWSSAPSLCGRTVITVAHPITQDGRDLPASPRRIHAVAEVELACPR
jgi:hypothetical protein